MTFTDAVAAATTRALDELLWHRAPDGRIHRACSSRLIESALTLHLVRDRPGHHGRGDRLRTYCRAAAEAAAREAEPNPLAALDRAFCRAVAAAVLDAPDKHALGDALLDLANRLDHPSRGRKLRLLRALLAEIAPTVAAGTPADGPEPPAAHQEWTRLLLTAVGLLEDARRPNPGAPAGAAAWLASHQRPNGSWGKHMLLTVTALIALDKAGGHAGVVERGIDFVVGQMRPDGGIPFVPDVDVWLTALVGLGAATWGGVRRDLAPLAAFVASHQLPSGTWAFTDGVDVGDADDTGTCAAFLDRYGGGPQLAAAAERGRRALLEFQNADGGFATYVRGAPSEAEITARAVFVLGRHVDRHATELGHAVRWLADVQREDGTFPFEWTLSPYYPIAQVVSALTELPEQTAAAGRLLDRAVEHLVRTQNADGGWGPVAGLASRVLPTTYAVLALARAPQSDVGALSTGIEFLLRAQRPSGAFRSPPDALGPRPFIFEMDLFPTVYAFLALAAAHERLSGRRSRVPARVGRSG